MLTVKPNELIETIWPLVQADIPPLITGRTGIGKSSMMKNELMSRVRHIWNDARWHDYRISTMDTTDGSGIPDLYTDDNGERATRWSRPGLVPADDGFMHVFCLDEVTHASVQLQHSIVYRFTLDRQLGDYKLPKLNRVILCANTKEDKGGDNNLVTPLNARIAHVRVLNDVESFRQWGVENGLDERLLAFWKMSGEKVLHKPSEGSNAVVCERTAEMLSRVMVQAGNNLEVIENCATALWGQGPAIQLVGFIRDLGKMPRLSEIKANPDTCRVPPDVHHQYAIASAIAKQITKEDANIWAKYLQRLSPDVASMAAHEAINKKRFELSGSILEKLIIN